MKKFLLALLMVFLVACQSGIGEFEISDQVYFEPLKENDFVINDYITDNDSALDFMKDSENTYRLSILLYVDAALENKEQFSVNVINDELNKVLDKYVYPFTEGLMLSDIQSNTSKTNYTFNYILILDETQKEEVITLIKETPLRIKTVGDKSGLKEIAYALTDFDN